MTKEKVKETDVFDFEPGGCQYEEVFAKIGARRAAMRHQQKLHECDRRSKDAQTMRLVSYPLAVQPDKLVAPTT